MSNKTHIITPEYLRRRDLITTMRAIKNLRNIVTAAEIKLLDSLDFCIRPVKELQEEQYKVHKLYGYGEASRQIIPRSSIAIGKTATAAALFYGSSNGLEYRSHRFTFVGKELEYHREPYNVDCQSLGSNAINLASARTIASEPTAKNELLWLAGCLGGIHPDSWTLHTVRTVAC